MVHLDVACARLELLYAVVYAFGGIPLLYMGDELGVRNDTAFVRDPAKRDDNRWMHRPPMDWAVADRRLVPGTLEARLFQLFVALGRDRASIGALNAASQLEVRESDPPVFCFTRTHPAHGTFTMVANFGHRPAVVELVALGAWEATVRRVSGAVVQADGVAQLSANGYLWITTP